MTNPAPAPQPDPLLPKIALLCKLASIVQHADEMFSPKSHHYDKIVLQTLLADTEVQEWLKKMGPLVPLKR